MLRQMKPVSSLEDVKKHKCVSFSIDFDVEKPSVSHVSVPSRLLQRQEERKNRQSQNLMSYTDEESMLIAEIMKEASLNEIKYKAGRVDHKLFDASRRRMCVNYLKEQSSKAKEAEKKTPDIRERQRRVKEMATASRAKASSSPLSVCQ
ncbi:uncharacterized protein LOC132746970 [Ruditapes philippinarum]|uniref:uncharacterized protein LOC132746970 n=1 Tax=Ruditapes philippinarum TaxID=129788 RepID=UPI00295BA5E2|nr:uncharacterized protein LOC132746970 [Ruditapes philippinarum]